MLATEIVQLGRSRVTVTRLGLGTAALGAFAADRDAEAAAIIRRATTAGIRHVDTAPSYGLGRAESRVGQVLPELDRDQITISTKVGRSFEPLGLLAKVGSVLKEVKQEPRRGATVLKRGGAGLVRRAVGRTPEGGIGSGWRGVVEDVTYDGAMRSVEASLERLRTDRIDVLFIHEPSEPLGTVMDGAYLALDRLRHEGQVMAIGVGSNDSAQLEAYARAGDFDCLLLGYQYSLMDQAAGASLLPFASERGIPVILGGPFNSGILADPQPGATYAYRPASAAQVGRAVALRDVASRHHVSIKAAALQFPFRHSAVISVLTGASSVAELDENMTLMEQTIPDALWEEYRHERLLGDVQPYAAG